jgi:hypothetical protein
MSLNIECADVVFDTNAESVGENAALYCEIVAFYEIKHISLFDSSHLFHLNKKIQENLVL